MDKNVLRKVFVCIALFFLTFALVSCGDLLGGNTKNNNGNTETDETDNQEQHTHQWGPWTQTKAPTATEDGEEKRVCALDSTHVETRPIPKTGGDGTISAWGLFYEEHILTFFLNEKDKTFTYHGADYPIPRGTYTLDGTKITFTFTVNPPPPGEPVVTGTISAAELVFDGQTYTKQSSNPFLGTASWAGAGSITEGPLTLNFGAMAFICRADGSYEQVSYLESTSGPGAPGFEMPAIIKNTGYYSFIGSRASFGQEKTSHDGGVEYTVDTKDPGEPVTIVDGGIPVSPDITLTPVTGAQLNGTSWKATVTEEINDVEETYDIQLDFGESEIQFSDTSSEPSSLQFDYSVSGNTVTVVYGNDSTTGIITGGDTLRINLFAPHKSAGSLKKQP